MESFNINFFLFIPLVTVFVLAYNKVPAFPTVMIGALLGGFFAVMFQPEAVTNLSLDRSCQNF